MPNPPQETLFIRTRPIDLSSADLTMNAVRFGYQRLFDEALHEVQCLGYDLDNVVFDRMLDCLVDGRELCLPVPFVSTLELLAGSIEQGIRDALGRSHSAASVHVTALRVVAVRHKVF